VTIPWISERILDENETRTAQMFHGTWSVLFNLITLLWEIEQSAKEKERYVLVEAPRSLVYHGYGDAWYGFRKNSRVPFVSIEMHIGIASVGFRYNDPLDPASGCRNDTTVRTGWQGTAELIDAAVRRSKLWKRCETVETESWNDSGSRVTYDVWAYPQIRREISWNQTPHYQAGRIAFSPGRAVKLATVHVVRAYIEGQQTEQVVGLTLFPDLSAERMYDDEDLPSNENWQLLPAQWSTPRIPLPMPVYLDLSDQMMTRIQPHDGFELKINWL